MALRSIPSTLQAIADLLPALKKLMVLKCWSHASQSKQARLAKQRKTDRRQQAFDDHLLQAAHKSKQEGSHSLYKVIRRFRAGKPQERVQLRDAQDRFLTSEEERKQLEQYSLDLFGTGEDFPLKRVQGSLDVTAAEVREQLMSIKVGKAVPKDSPPVVAWRSLGPKAHQYIADILNQEVAQGDLSATLTSSQISWLPKPPKKPDKPASLGPIGVIAPEGKILAGLIRKRLKSTLHSAMAGVTQFGFVPGRGTEEAICKALTHVDEARTGAETFQTLRSII